MKTASLPPIRVDPRVKKEIEAVLEPGETLSSFIVRAVTKTAAVRRVQHEFVERAEARSKAAHRSGRHVTADAVYRRLELALTKARKKAR